MEIARLAAIAERTAGVFTPAMAEDAGVTRHSLASLRGSRDVSSVCGRGFLIGAAPATLEQRAIAARLTWPESIVCFRTAASMYGWPVDDDAATHVLLPNGRKPFGGLATHQWSVRPTEVVDAGLWRITDRTTTLADCLGRLPASEAWGLLAWLWTRDLISVDDLEAQIADRKKLYGIVRLRRMLAAVRRGAVSPTEIELQDFLTDRGFTGWLGDQKIIVRGRIIARVDILFLEERVVIEFDGRLAHPESAAAEDRARDLRLSALGYHVIRVRWERLIHEPRDLVKEIRRALRTRAA